jgi:putative oxidoreductase
VLFRETHHVPVLPPELAAVLGSFGELAFPVLIALDLAARFGAAGLFFVTVMAVASYLELFGFECPAGINAHYYWGSILGALVALVAFGPGRLSLDAWIVRRLGGSETRARSAAATA